MKLVSLDLKKLVKQKEIDLRYKGLNDDDLDVLYKVIARSTVLEGLNLGSNKLTLSDGKLANAIAKNTTLCLKSLCLSFNSISDDGIKHLADALKKNNILQKLNLGGNCIDVEGAKYVAAEILAVNNSLQVIDLRNNKIGNDGAESIAVSLINTSIREIYLQRNKIGDEGVKHLANALKKNNTLQELYLADNNFGDEGAKYIAEMLAVNETLQEIDLCYNNIRDDGAQGIASSLAVNTSIRTINLNHNNISSMGAEKLAGALECNHSIKSLVLYNNYNISKDVKDRIRALTHKNRNKVVTRVTPSDNANTSTNSMERIVLQLEQSQLPSNNSK